MVAEFNEKSHEQDRQDEQDKEKEMKQSCFLFDPDHPVHSV
jgi:hypothetical protein